MKLALDVKPFTFQLKKPLHTSKGILKEKRGWLIKLKSSEGHYGWGEVSAINPSENNCYKEYFQKLGKSPLRKSLEEIIQISPGPLAFGIGAALADLDEIIYSGKEKWHLKAPRSAVLLPHLKYLKSELERAIYDLDIK